MTRTLETHLSAARATHRAESDATGRNKSLATIVSGDGRLAGVDLGRRGTTLLGVGLGSLLPPAQGTLRVITGQAIDGILGAAGRVGRAAVDRGRARGARVESSSGRGWDGGELGNHKSGRHIGRCLWGHSRLFAPLSPGRHPRRRVDLLVNQIEDLIVIVEGEKFLNGGLLLELPDREHLGGWAAILAELDGDDTRVDKNVKIEAFASVKEEEPISPVDGAGLAGTCDEGGRGGGWGEANSTTLKANLGTSVPVTGCGIASGKGACERALDEIYRADWVGRVEERGRKESNGMLDGLGENRRHGEWRMGVGGWMSTTVVVVRTGLIRMVALRINGKSESVKEVVERSRGIGAT